MQSSDIYHVEDESDREEATPRKMDGKSKM